MTILQCSDFFILLLLVSQTYLDVLFNSWYKDFYDILQTAEKRNISEFWDSIEKFLYIALPYVTLFAFTNWFTRLWAFRWREAMTFSYMPYWRATEAKVEGSSQRIQEDCMAFAKIVESIGLLRKYFGAICLFQCNDHGNKEKPWHIEMCGFLSLMKIRIIYLI